MPRFLIAVLLLITSFGAVRAQYSLNTDSLWKVYRNAALTDTVRMRALQQLNTVVMANNPDSGLIICDTLYAFAKSKGNEKFMGQATHSRGIIFKVKGQYSQSVRAYFETLQHWSAAGFDEGLANCHQNLANVYGRLHQPDKARIHYDTAIAMYLSMENEAGVGSAYNDMGNMYMTDGYDSLALVFLERSLEIRQRLGNERGAAVTSSNIAGVYLARNEPGKALEYLVPFHNYAMKSGRQAYIIAALTTYGEIFLMKGEFGRARDSCLRALEYNEQFNSIEREQFACECLKNAYDSLGQYKEALHYYTRFVVARDSLQNQSQRDEITRLELESKYTKKQVADSLKVVEDKKIAAAKSEGERKLRYALFAGLGLTIIFGVVMFNRFRVTQKQRNLIAEQNFKTAEQKKLIEEKNKEITDSINYAQRIQQAVLPSEVELKKHFVDIFVLFKPRDIVSGDFYWYDETPSKKVIALADCTGHGVPGGFMSMLGYEILQDVVMQEDIHATSEAMHRLDEKVTISLNKNDRSHRDGMDMVLCSFSKSKSVLQFSGANRPLVHVSNGQLNYYKPDKHTIGGAIDEAEKKFTHTEIQLSPGDMIYLFSDGYADQFGGPQGKKFMSKQLEEKLLQIAAKSCVDQKKELETSFGSWKGTLEQVDDVCIIGIRI